MKITVTPMPSKNAIENYLMNEKLSQAFEDCTRKAKCSGDGRFDDRRSVTKKNAKRQYDANREIFRSVCNCFWDIGYRKGFCQGDAKTDIRFQSTLPGGMKDLVFKNVEEAKNWLIKAEMWKEGK